MDELHRLHLEIVDIKAQMNRLISNAESEKETTKRMHDMIMKRIGDVDNELKNVLYGEDRQNGIIVEIDRLKQESKQAKSNKQNIFALWIAAGGLIVKELLTYLMDKK